MLKIYNKFLIYISLAFVLFTIVGTISHEYGHILTAKYLDYDTVLHYGSMNYLNVESNELKELYQKNKNEIIKKLDFPDKIYYEQLNEKLKYNSLLISIGGPLQTMLTSLLGLLILFYRKSKVQINFKLIDWLAVFLALFSLRQVSNLLISFVKELVKPNGSYFGGDEYWISKTLEVPEGTFSIILGLISLIIALYVIFKVIPKKIQYTFIVGGFLGGIVGFVFWMKLIGPTLLP